MTLPRLEDDGRLRLTLQETVDPEEVVIQASWSETRDRWLGLVPRTKVWWHVELRSGGTRVRLRARLAGPEDVPSDTPHQAMSQGTEVAADALRELLTGLRELGARDVRVAADVGSSLDADDIEDELSVGTRVGDAPSGDAPASEDDEPSEKPAARLAPVLSVADCGRYERSPGLKEVLWGGLLLVLWLVVVPKALDAGASTFPLFVAAPASLALLSRLRSALGHTTALPHAPIGSWLPQRFGVQRRPSSETSGNLTVTIALWTVWFGFWLALADAADVTSSPPPLLVVGVGVGLVVSLVVDLRREWATARIARVLTRQGQLGVSATRRGPSSTIEVVERRTGVGRSRGTTYAMKESVTTPDSLSIWQDGETRTLSTSGATWLSSCHAEIADGHAWRVPRGARVLWTERDGALVLYATVGERPRRELEFGLAALLLSTVIVVALAVGVVVWTLMG